MPATPDDRLIAAQRHLGLRLREVRMREGLTLPDVSAATGLSVGHLSDVERGRTIPSLSALLNLSDAYGVLVIDLLAVYPFGSAKQPRSLPEPPPDGRSVRRR